MKSLQKLSHDFHMASHRLGQSHRTQEARLSTAATFVKCIEANGVQIDTLKQIGGRHLRMFVAHQLQGSAPSTVRNQMAHLRECLRAVDKHALADDPTYSNANLGIPKTSRKGKKIPLTAEQVENLYAQAVARGRPGHGIGIKLQFVIGLRAEEIVQSSASVLARWLLELADGDAITVSEGTKGGYVRQTHVPDKEAAIAVITEALAIARRQGGFLIQHINPSPLSLEQAINCYCNYFDYRGVQTHSARYSFACKRMEAYMATGMTLKQALSRTGRDLGHGPGRGRWVKSVYLAYWLEKSGTTL